MTKRQFVVLAFRLFALHLLFNLVSSLGYIFSIRSGLGTGVLSYYLIPAVAIFASLAFISLLWLKSEWLMQKIFAIPVLSDEVKQESGDGGNADETNSDIPNGSLILSSDQDSSGMLDYYETSLSKESIEIVAFSLVGLLEALNQVPHLLRDFDLVFDTGFFSFNWFTIRAFLPDLIQVALGIWLFLRPWQFQGWIEKFKPKGDEMD